MPFFASKLLTYVVTLQVEKRNENIRVIKTNLMHCFSSVYFVNQPLHISGIFFVDCLLARPTDSQQKILMKIDI